MSPTKGNINLKIRPRVENQDGSYSTVRSIGIEVDGMYINIPTVINGKVVSNAEAIRNYQKTGKHLGKFKTKKQRDEAAKKLSIDQSKMYGK